MSKIDYNELVEFARTNDEYYVADFMFADNKRIAELEKELAIKDKMINLIWIDLFHLNNDNNDWTKSLDKYKQEAQAKLKEIQGE